MIQITIFPFFLSLDARGEKLRLVRSRITGLIGAIPERVQAGRGLIAPESFPVPPYIQSRERRPPRKRLTNRSQRSEAD